MRQHTDRIQDIIDKYGTVAHEGRAEAGTSFFEIFRFRQRSQELDSRDLPPHLYI